VDGVVDGDEVWDIGTGDLRDATLREKAGWCFGTGGGDGEGTGERNLTVGGFALAGQSSRLHRGDSHSFIQHAVFVDSGRAAKFGL
jgi:hypothetical protein